MASILSAFTRANIGKFLGNTVSSAAGFAAGVAVGPVLAPATQALRNEVWQKYPNVPPPFALLAEGVAQGQVSESKARAWAKEQGYGEDQMTALIDIANTGPPLGAALDAFRRGLLTLPEYTTALKRQGIEEQWFTALVGLKNVLLSGDELANAVVQGYKDFDAAAADALLLGISGPNFQTMVDVTGLPPGPETLLAWWRRGIITQAEFEQGIREGHTKVKYIGPYEKARSPVLSHVTYAGLRLRGWLTKAESDAGGELTGYTPEQMELEFLDRGRPATAHQIHIGYARGATVPGAANEVEAIRKAVAESDIRPEYEDVIVAGRYTLPSWFALRSLVTSGAITPARGEQILVQSGWQPDLAAEVVASLAPGGAAKPVDPYLAKADSQLWTALHKAYVKTGVVRATVEPVLDKLVKSQADRDEIFGDWDLEKAINAAPAPPTP